MPPEAAGHLRDDVLLQAAGYSNVARTTEYHASVHRIQCFIVSRLYNAIYMQ